MENLLNLTLKICLNLLSYNPLLGFKVMIGILYEAIKLYL